MLETVIVLLIMALAVAGILAHPHLVRRRQNQLKHLPFPALWQATIENNLPIYSRLSPDQRRQLQGYIQVFLAEKQFIGCNGLQITEEMKLTIAAGACLLLLNNRGKYFPNLRSILVYPSVYWVDAKTSMGGYVVQEQRVARLGESWTYDQVVLSWERVQQDTHNWKDGHNVVLHEFAHQLDQEDGSAEGVPVLPQKADYDVWAKVMTLEYQQLCKKTEQGARTVLDKYGATNPAEFFAVATETFFEKPQQLLKQHPDLYEQLQRYYQLDPLDWIK